MSHANWTLAAETDAEDIYAWIAFHEARRSTAKKTLRALRQECDEYGNAFVAGSILGTARPDLGESFRVFTHRRWVVVFRPIDDGIEVLRVLDGSRDYPRLFGN